MKTARARLSLSFGVEPGPNGAVRQDPMNEASELIVWRLDYGFSSAAGESSSARTSSQNSKSASRCAFRAESAHHSIAWAASVPNKSRVALARLRGTAGPKATVFFRCGRRAGGTSSCFARGDTLNRRCHRWAFHITRSPHWYIITDMQTSSRRFRGYGSAWSLPGMNAPGCSASPMRVRSPSAVRS